MVFYRVSFDEPYVEEGTGYGVCDIDYKPARSDLGQKQKDKAVDVRVVVMYAMNEALGGDRIPTPKYFWTDKDKLGLAEEMENINNSVINYLKEMLKISENKEEKALTNA